MCRILRPLSSLVVLLIACSMASAQNTPAFIRAHRNNPKHRVQAQRLERQSQVQEESLQPYQERIALHKRVKKGTRGLTFSAEALSAPEQQLYLESRRSVRSTRENPEKYPD